MLVDTHCHLHDREFFSEEEAQNFLENARKSSVKTIICIGTSHEDSVEAKKFAERNAGVYFTYGVHPENLASRIDFSQVKNSKKLVGIGEIGLDYHYLPETREKQIELFQKMLQIASDFNLPVSFHVREAFDDFFPVVKNFPKVRGVLHSFSDNKKILKKILLETEFFVGVNGMATYSTLPTPPISRIILETDAPFLTPEPNRGKINQPAYIKNIAEFLSKKLEISPEKVAEITTENARRLYKFSYSDAKPAKKGA